MGLLLSIYLIIGVLMCVIVFGIGRLTNPDTIYNLGSDKMLLKVALLILIAWPWGIYRAYKTWNE